MNGDYNTGSIYFYIKANRTASASSYDCIETIGNFSIASCTLALMGQGDHFAILAKGALNLTNTGALLVSN